MWDTMEEVMIFLGLPLCSPGKEQPVEGEIKHSSSSSCLFGPQTGFTLHVQFCRNSPPKSETL